MAQRGEERIDAAERVVGLHLAREDVRKRERLPLREHGGFFLLSKWLGRIEGAREAEVGKFRPGLGQRVALPDGVAEVFRVNLHVLAVAQIFALDFHHTVLVGDEVVEHRRAGREEVEVCFRCAGLRVISNSRNCSCGTRCARSPAGSRGCELRRCLIERLKSRVAHLPWI